MPVFSALFTSPKQSNSGFIDGLVNEILTSKNRRLFSNFRQTKITLFIYETQNEGNTTKNNKFQAVVSCSVLYSSKIFTFTSSNT